MAQVKNIWDILLKRFPANEYALMEEVSDAAGFSRSRSADYIAVNLWPSRGLSINGIELKSFRSDWLGELKKPAKAENIYQYCDYFWLLTSDDTVAKIEEIPSTWGWLCVTGRGIKTMKDAPKLTPVPVSKHFMCAMLKRACDKEGWIKVDTIQEKIDAEKEKAVNAAHNSDKYRLEEYATLLKNVREFESASGMRIDRWNGAKKMGEAVAFIESGGTDKIVKDLIRLKQTVDHISKTINIQLEDEVFKPKTEAIEQANNA